MTDLKSKRITVTGGAGFLGGFVTAALRERGCTDVFIPRFEDYDLVAHTNVKRMYDDFRPDLVIHLAAVVGGIGANREHPGEFYFKNMAMGLFLLEEARLRQIVGKLAAYQSGTHHEYSLAMVFRAACAVPACRQCRMEYGKVLQ